MSFIKCSMLMQRMEEYAMEHLGSEFGDSERASVLEMDMHWNWEGAFLL